MTITMQQQPLLLAQRVVYFDDFVDCWEWLADHPHFFYAPSPELPQKVLRRVAAEPGFTESLDIYCGRVDPETERFNPNNRVANTQPHVMLEVGPWSPCERFPYSGEPCHEPALDTGGATFELAICTLAHRVLELYGSYPFYEQCAHCQATLPAGQVTGDWFCSPECEAHGAHPWKRERLADGNYRIIPPEEIFSCEHWHEEKQ